MLKIDSTKTVRECSSDYAKIWIEIYNDSPTECILTYLRVREEHRRKGYGGQALADAEEIARRLGCNIAYLKVEANTWVHEWYLRRGYKYLSDDSDEDTAHVWLYKRLI